MLKNNLQNHISKLEIEKNVIKQKIRGWKAYIPVLESRIQDYKSQLKKL